MKRGFSWLTLREFSWLEVQEFLTLKKIFTMQSMKTLILIKAPSSDLRDSGKRGHLLSGSRQTHGQTHFLPILRKSPPGSPEILPYRPAAISARRPVPIFPSDGKKTSLANSLVPGLIAGLGLLLIDVTGSLLVFRNEIEVLAAPDHAGGAHRRRVGRRGQNSSPPPPSGRAPDQTTTGGFQMTTGQLQTTTDGFQMTTGQPQTTADGFQMNAGQL
ncbi:MAG: hypothetical protein V4726_02055, partial [Verrucomicrobiota bacterium]